MAEEPLRFRTLCATMDRYYKDLGRASEALYARLLAGSTTSPQEIRKLVESSLQAGDVRGADEIVAAAQDAPLSPDTRWLVELAKSDIALASGALERAASRLEPILDAAEQNQDRIALLEQRIAALSQGGDATSQTTIRLVLCLYRHRAPDAGQLDELMTLASNLQRQYLSDLATDAYTTARMWAQTLDNHQAEGRALRGLGDLARLRDDYPAAGHAYHQARDLATQLDDRWGLAAALLGLGDVALERRDLPSSERHYVRARDLFKQIGARRGQASALLGLGRVMQRRGDLVAAETYYHDALALYKQLDDRLGQATTLRSLGNLALSRRDPPKARDYYTWALNWSRQIDDHSGEAYALMGRAQAAMMNTNIREARVDARDSLTLFIAMTNRDMECELYKLLARIAEGEHHSHEAASYLEQANRVCADEPKRTPRVHDTSTGGRLIVAVELP